MVKKCKECGKKLPIEDEFENEPKEGEFFFTCISNPESDNLTTKRMDFFCSIECMKKNLFDDYPEDKEVITKEELYKKAIEEWGIISQQGMLVEEMGESLTALNKYKRNVNSCELEDFISELIDVEIMIEQMKTAYEITNKEWKTRKKIKLNQLADRLEIERDEWNPNRVVEEKNE